MSNTGEGINPGTAFVVVVGMILAMIGCCAISAACGRRDGGGDAQQQNGRPQTGDRDGNMVVLDGIQIAQTAVEVQPGCCCGDGDGDGGGCGGCGGD